MSGCQRGVLLASTSSREYKVLLSLALMKGAADRRAFSLMRESVVYPKYFARSSAVTPSSLQMASMLCCFQLFSVIKLRRLRMFFSQLS